MPADSSNKLQQGFILLVLAIVAVGFIGMIRAFLIALVLAAIFSGLLYPLYRRILAAMNNRALPASATMIINDTATGSNNDLPLIPAELVNSHFLCYDMMYNLNAETGFVAWSRANGAAHACNGLGILVEQAAESFRI